MDDVTRELREAGVDPATLARLTEDGEDGPEDGWVFAVSAPEAVTVWERLRLSVDRTGYWPVMLGGEDDLELHRQVLEEDDEQTPQDAIRQGLGMDVPAWFAEREEDAGLDGYQGDWPSGDHANHVLSVPLNVRNIRPPQPGEGPAVYFGLVPARAGWEVPAHLRWGGWDDCPPAEEHVGVMKYWNERYGAELVCATHAVIEMQVARPPKTREEALQLATEQFLYCGDIVTQGVETLERLASTLLGATVWYFWWD